MSKIYTSMLQLIGNTPLLKPERYNNAAGVAANLLVKLDAFNPAGSAKDRIAKAMIEDAEKKGILKEGSVIIEPTSGNTGIGLAAIGAYLGYRVIIVMPDSMTVERRKLMQIYGAELVLTPGAQGMSGAIAKADVLAQEIPGAIVAGQFENPANPQAHIDTTGPELWQQMEGQIDILVAGVGTGGSISGTGRYLKDQNPAIKVVAVEPASSAVLSGGQAGPHAIQGIGAGFVPKALDTTIYDQTISVSNEDALAIVGSLARSEGLFMGISSAAALIGALEAAKQPENAGKNIVVLLPDTGMRYLSTEEIFA